MLLVGQGVTDGWIDGFRRGQGGGGQGGLGDVLVVGAMMRRRTARRYPAGTRTTRKYIVRRSVQPRRPPQAYTCVCGMVQPSSSGGSSSAGAAGASNHVRRSVRQNNALVSLGLTSGSAPANSLHIIYRHLLAPDQQLLQRRLRLRMRWNLARQGGNQVSAGCYDYNYGYVQWQRIK